ncbi:TetR/AcrR family transcriptional regulator [Sporosarcina psychrophila]|uniref:TetR/AcrR family transcriptional regulator n=1 Tax=Sporosarcina psychrophila TaxID=1476 RepID=UPI00078D7C70|nr:TetR/AcrR family transcriptional regulator [Sporosarcina psychrophila]AMQ07091.1 TetR family transcriptional regulator [Sporosarcina psychrophila]
MENKKIQRSRMWKYFVDATAEIIEEEGIENVTIRKVADRAGYNSATIYNYFTEISHLIFFASMKFLKTYTNDVQNAIEKGENPLEKYILSWECFCKHSFLQPQIFHAVFIMDLGNPPEKLLADYYEIYPTDLISFPEELKHILFERNVSKRGRSILEIAANEGFIDKVDIDKVNEMTILIWQGMLTNLLNNRTIHEVEKVSEITMDYITEIIQNSSKKVY